MGVLLLLAIKRQYVPFINIIPMNVYDGDRQSEAVIIVYVIQSSKYLMTIPSVHIWGINELAFENPFVWLDIIYNYQKFDKHYNYYCIFWINDFHIVPDLHFF